MAYNALNNLIDAYIYANGVQAITGQILNGVLKQMVSQLGSGYHLMGVAGPETVPEQNDFAMAYFAATAGEYTDFGGITLAAGEVAVLLTSGNGSWSKQTIYTVPTTTEDLENTAGFITNAVTDLVNYYTKTEVDDTLADYPTLEALATALADYYTKQEVDTTLADYATKDGVDETLEDYYTKDEVDAELADRYTKQETDTKLEDYYKKTETYDKDEVDSIVAALSRQEYIVAWDGLAAPDVSSIPAGVTVTYSGTTYTGTLAASASTVNKIYMVWNGVAYDMYGTSQDGGYSWVPMGTTSVDLSQYATKAELSQLQQKVDEDLGDIEQRLGTIEIPMIDGAYIKTNLAVGSQVDITPNANSAWRYAIFPVEAGDKLTITAYGGMNPKPFAFVDASYVMVENTDLVYTNALVKIAPENAKYVIINDSQSGKSYYLSKDSIDTKFDNLDGQIDTIQDDVALNRELIEMSNNGLTIFNPSLFTRGTITSGGELVTTIQYSIANAEIQTATEDIHIDSIDEDFRCNIYYYVNGVYDDAEGDIQVPFIIQSGKEFRLLILRQEVDMQEVADIVTFVKTISIKTKIGAFVEDDSTPLGKILHDGGYTSLFHHLGCIGDSLSSGAVFKELPGGGYYGEDKLEYSWGQVIARMCGITCHNFSFGGASTRSWIQNFINRTGSQVGNIEFLEDYPCEAYTIALSVNDADYDGANYVPVGSPDDIDLNDMDECADTFYGNYAHIIMFIKSIVPKAKIFLITDPRHSAFNITYRDAVRYIATLFDNVYLIDLYAYGRQYYTNDVLLDGLWVNGHLTAQGYIRSAWHISTYIDWIVRNNPEDFQEVPYILDS